ISTRLYKESTFRKAAQFYRRETESFRKRADLVRGSISVAREEHDSLATRYGLARKMMLALTASASVVGMISGPIAAAADAKFCGSRVVATDTSMPLRANALARAWPIWPKPIIA